MSIIHRFIPLALAIVCGFAGSAQPSNADSLWRVWGDTSLAVEDRDPALLELFQIDTNLTAAAAVSRIMPLRGADTLSRAYVLQLGIARFVEGVDHAEHARYTEAFSLLQQAAGGFKRINELLLEFTTNRAIGQLFVQLGQFNAAANFQTQALKGAETLGDTTNIFLALSNIAYAYGQMGDYLRSEQGYRRCLELVAGRDAEREFETLSRLHYFGGAFPTALSADGCLQRAKALVARGEVTNGKVRLARLEAGHFLNAGECDSALVRFEQELVRRRSALRPHPGWISYSLSMVAAAHLCAHRYKQAVQCAKEGLSIAREHGLVKETMDNLKPLAKGYEGLGEDRNALRTWKQYYAGKDSADATSSAANLSGSLLAADFAKQQFADSLNMARDRELERRTAEVNIQRERTRRNIFLFSGLGLLVFGVVVFRQRGRIQKALHRSDELLLNILPEEVAEELKAKGHADAKHFDNVTILFTDFKGFTEASEKLSPQELVEELNTCFKAFDGIITARGIEKIKTIGDAYMCAGGLPVPASSTPAGVVHAALEMQAFMVARKKERDAQGKPAFEMRVGIHTGPVVAGIVGVKKFAYDIWGDTVNTASRMESSGEVGQVNISEATYALVKDAIIAEAGVASTHRVDPNRAGDGKGVTGTCKFTFTPRGKVQAKGKGQMEMFFVDHSAKGA
jgi:class 3 adenylate cyclase